MSTPERHRQLVDLFNAARERPIADRATILDQACTSDPVLRREVEALLARDAETSNALDRPVLGPEVAGSVMAVETRDDHAGEFIGPYKLLSVIGEGGFGIVWLAERREPMVQRVALKIIKAGMDSAAVVARFEQERQALAVMDHPNVARVFDGGVTPETMGARPYFVMEHVQGEPITDYCDRHTLTIRQRLELFIPVCEAVQHAHLKGIIHRDLKPSNILVTVKDSEAIPKVIDFGVAKAIHHTLTEKSIFTEQGQLIGTPEYMSPEQANMDTLDIDTRTDVYSLGIVLYQLLSGLLPFDTKSLRAEGFEAIRRVIHEQDAPKPSTRLTSAADADGDACARLRRIHRSQLTAALRRELDWIPLKAIRRDRAERYGSPSDLARDIRHYLEGQPLEAGPESAAYRMRKFARRYRGPLIAAVAVVLALATGLATTLWQKRETQRHARAESAARQRAEAIIEFVTKSLQSSDPNQGGAQGLTVAEAMTQALARLDHGDLKDQPEAVAELLRTIAGILNGNGKSDTAEAPAERSLRIERELHNGDHPEVASSLNNLALVRESLGRSAEAESLYAQALEMYQRIYKGDHPAVATALANLASARQALGRDAEAELLMVQALEMTKRIFKGDHPDVASSLISLADLLVSLGRREEAESQYVKALEMRRRLFVGDHPDVADTLNGLAMVRVSLGRTAQAEPMCIEALEMYRRLFHGDHPEIARGLCNLGDMLRWKGRDAEAEPLLQQSLEMNQRLIGGDHRAIATVLDRLASCRLALGKLDKAEEGAQSALEMNQRLFEGDHPDIAQCLSDLAHVRRAMGRTEEAEPLYARALEMRRRLFDGDHPDVARSLVDLAMVRKSLGRPTEAEPLCVQALEMNRRLFDADHPDVAVCLNDLASLRLDLGRPAEAEPLFAQALEIKRRLFKGDHPAVAGGLNNLAHVLSLQDRAAEAEPLFAEALGMYQRLFKGDHPDVVGTLMNLAGCLAKLNRLPEALSRAREAADMAARVLPEGHPVRKMCNHTLDQITKQIDDSGVRPAASPGG